MNHYSGNDPALGCGLVIVWLLAIAFLVFAFVLGLNLP